MGHVPADGFLEAAALSVLELRGVELCLGSHLAAFGARDQSRAQFLEGVGVELRIGRFRHQLVLGAEGEGDAARAEEIEHPVVVFHVRYRYGNVDGQHRFCVGEDLRLVQPRHLSVSRELALALSTLRGPIPSKFFRGGGGGGGGGGGEGSRCGYIVCRSGGSWYRIIGCVEAGELWARVFAGQGYSHSLLSL